MDVKERTIAKSPILSVIAEWDDESKTFFAYSDDIPGLATEAATWERLIERVEAIAPELLDLNHIDSAATHIAIQHKNLYVPLKREQVSA
ncbi:MAG: DUF1902 domain-containing protein [Proteobacteria bacterium]|nr:DUF1902 domain-containing protein [Pseudomonadota bacterium]